MFEVDLGKVKFNWEGTYSASTVYEKDDVVFYDGSAWVFINETPTSAQTPSTTNTTYWNMMAQGSDLGGLAGLSAGDLVYYDGTNFQRVQNDQNSHASLVHRPSGPIMKPQGIIQVQKFKTKKLMRVNSGNNITALSWYPIDQSYENNAWGNEAFEVAITPKFANSILKVELSLHVGWRGGSYHSFGRITHYDGTNWVRHPDDQESSWHAAQGHTEADHGAYTYTTNGATYVYQGEQVQLTKYYDVDGVNFTAGTETKFRWEYTSTSGSHYVWLNASTDYYTNNYARSGNSHIAVTEINNGD